VSTGLFVLLFGIGLVGAALAAMVLFLRPRRRLGAVRIALAIAVVIVTIVAIWFIDDMSSLPNWDHTDFNFSVH
jgi:uncharacterized membrane protein